VKLFNLEVWIKLCTQPWLNKDTNRLIVFFGLPKMQLMVTTS
jgi:hypothetical protein